MQPAGENFFAIRNTGCNKPYTTLLPVLFNYSDAGCSKPDLFLRLGNGVNFRL